MTPHATHTLDSGLLIQPYRMLFHKPIVQCILFLATLTLGNRVSVLLRTRIIFVQISKTWANKLSINLHSNKIQNKKREIPISCCTTHLQFRVLYVVQCYFHLAPVQSNYSFHWIIGSITWSYMHTFTCTIEISVSPMKPFFIFCSLALFSFFRYIFSVVIYYNIFAFTFGYVLKLVFFFIGSSATNNH